MNLLLIFLGGGAGAISRYAMMNAVSRYLGAPVFPWATLSVNILGAFIIGVLMEILALRLSIGGAAKLLLVTGFLGGFTTFSAFSLEGALMFERHEYATLGVYIAASVIGTIIAVFMGSGLVRSFS